MSDGTTLHVFLDGDKITSAFPGYATKFSSEQALKDALDNVEPGTPAFDAKVWDSGKMVWIVEHPGNFGYGFKPNGVGGPKQMLKVTSWYDEVSTGVYQLITMFPNL